MRRLLSIFFSAFFFAVCLLASPAAQAEPISWADKSFDFKTIHTIYLNDLDLTKVTLGSNVLELNARDQLKESSKKTNLKVMYDVPYTYQTDAVVHVAIEKFDAEIIHIPAHTSVVFVDPPFWAHRHWRWHYYPSVVPVQEPAMDIPCQIIKLHCIVKDRRNEAVIYEYEDTRQINPDNTQKEFKKMFNDLFKSIKKITH